MMRWTAGLSRNLERRGAMTEDLGGRVAIVTGGGRGIGRTIAEGLAKAGAAVAVTGRSAGHLQEAVAAIEKAGGRGLAFAADVTDQPAVRRLVAETESKLGPVDILVNNAAMEGPLGPLWELDTAQWRRCLEVNLMGPIICSQAVLPGMVARRRGRSASSSPPAPRTASPVATSALTTTSGTWRAAPRRSATATCTRCACARRRGRRRRACSSSRAPRRCQGTQP